MKIINYKTTCTSLREEDQYTICGIRPLMGGGPFLIFQTIFWTQNEPQQWFIKQNFCPISFKGLWYPLRALAEHSLTGVLNSFPSLISVAFFLPFPGVESTDPKSCQIIFVWQMCHICSHVSCRVFSPFITTCPCSPVTLVSQTVTPGSAAYMGGVVLCSKCISYDLWLTTFSYIFA